MGAYGLNFTHINTPLENAAQQATLGDILARKQERQQLAQENAMKLQAQQQEQQDRENFTRAYRDSNYDPAKALELAPRYGVSADGIAKRTEAHQKLQQTAVTLDDGKLKNLEAHGNLLAGYLDPITRITDPDPNIQSQKRASAYIDAVNSYQKVDPDGAKLLPPQYPGDAGLQDTLEHAMTIKGYAEHGLKVKQSAREDVQTTEALAKGATENAQAAGRIMGSLDLSNAPTETQQAIWKQQRGLLPPEAQKLVPEQWSPEAQAQVKKYLTTTAAATTNAKNAITEAVGTFAETHPQDAAGYEAFVNGLPDAVKTHFLAVVPVDQYDPEKSPAALNRSLLTPEQRINLNKPAGTGTPEQQFVTEYQRNHPKAGIAEAQRAFALNKHIVSPEAATNQLDREAARFAKPHETSVKDASAQLEKITDARAMVNGSAISQALSIPKVLTALVGGPGSGIRITKAELDSIAQARGIVGSFEGWANSISGQGKLSDTQKQQLTQVLDDVQGRLQQKRDIANEALDKINGARSRGEIIAIDSDVRKRLSNLEKPIPSKSLNQGATKTYKQSDVDAAVKAHPGLTPMQADAAFKAKGWVKQQ